MVQGALVVEALHAGAVDRVGVLAVGVVAVAAEPGFDARDAARAGAANAPVGRRRW